MSGQGEHPVEQPIRSIQIDTIAGLGPDGDGNTYFVGDHGVTRIEACQKSGLHANIPYVRVWAGDTCLAEFCQHNIVGVYFEPPSQPQADAPTPSKCEHGSVDIFDCPECRPF